MDPQDLWPDARGTIAFGFILPEEFETCPDIYDPLSLRGLMGHLPAAFCKGVCSLELPPFVGGLDDSAFPLDVPIILVVGIDIDT